MVTRVCAAGAFMSQSELSDPLAQSVVWIRIDDHLPNGGKALGDAQGRTPLILEDVKA